MLVTRASIRAKKFLGISSICCPARWLASFKIAAWIERDKSSACKACGLTSATSAASKAAILSAKLDCASSSAAAMVSAIPSSRPAIIPSALPRSNAAVTVSKLVAICAPLSASPLLSSATGSCFITSLARLSLVSARLAESLLKSWDLSSDLTSGFMSCIRFGWASTIGDCGLSSDAVCRRKSSAPSANIEAPSLFLSIADSWLFRTVSLGFSGLPTWAVPANAASARFATASASSDCLTASISASRCWASTAISIKLRGLKL